MQDKSYQPLRKEKEGSIVKSKASVRNFEYSTNRIMENEQRNENIMSGNWPVSTLNSPVADIYSDAILLTSNNRRNITWGRGWYQAYPRMQRRNQFSALRGSRLITADKRQTNASTQTKRLGQTKMTTEGVVTWRRFCFFQTCVRVVHE